MSQIQRFGTEYDGRSRQDLASLLLEETTRRWQPAEEQADLPVSPLSIPRPTTDDELGDFLADTLGVRFPRTPVCQGHSTPFAALCDAFFARSPVTVWKASRAFGGKTFLMGALAWAEALALRSSVTILGGTGEQSARVHEYLRDFWRSPSAPPGTTTNATTTKTRLIWGNTVTALTASMAAVSGPHPQRLRIDEVDLVDLSLLDQALGQPMSRGGVDAHVLLSSAHYSDNGTLTEVLKRAGPKGWHVHEWCVAPWTLVSTPSGPRRIDSLHYGDVVFGWNGRELATSEIAWAASTRESETIVLELTNGRELCLTPDHKVLTGSGWREAGECEVGELIVSEMLRPEDQGKQDVSPLLQHQRTEASGQPLRVRQGNSAQFASMLGLLPGRTRRQKQNTRDDHGHEQSASQDAAEAQSRRERHGGIVNLARRAVRAALAGLDLQPGLLPAGLSLNSGDLRPALASAGLGTGPVAPADNRERGLPVRSVMGGQAAPLARHATGYVGVSGRRRGPRITVWDCRVPGLDSFVAEGVVVHNCWRETVEPYGWLAKSEIERQRRVVTEEMWRVQYDLQEPNPEGRAIAPAKVERMFQGPSLHLADRDGCVPYREFEPPVDGATYATGSDWARMKDYVEIVTLRDDVWPMRLVAYQRFRKREIGYLVAAFDKQVTRFPGNSAHDATSMGGSFMHDLVGVDESVEGFVMVGAKRRALFNDYIVGVEFEEIVAPRIESLYQQHRTCRNADLFKSGPKDHPPDGVVACAMAYHASQASTRPLEVHRPREADPLAKLVTHPDPEPVVVQRSALGRALSAFSRKPDGNGNGHNGGNGNGSE